MATLSSELGVDLHDLTQDQLTDFIENLRSKRQSFTDNAYETRTTKRSAATKRKSPEITAEFLADLDDLDL